MATPPLQAVVLDIEGTTTPIAFVRDVLFPDARAQLPAYVRAHEAEPLVALALAQTGQPDVDSAIERLLHALDGDEKLTPLKTLQGLIWEAGYRSGRLQAPVYADVAPALRRWRALGLALHVYSSGSVAAQKLLFAHSSAGDLSGLFSHHFDTAIGPKLQATSYAAIARQLALPPSALLFVSDHPGEVAAAQTAGWRALRVERGQPLPASGPVVRSFEEVELAAGLLCQLDPARPSHRPILQSRQKPIPP